MGMKIYLLRDDFTDTRAAGAVDNTPAVPGAATRDVNDTGEDLTTGSGYLDFAQGANAWNDPVLAYAESLARGNGALMAVVRPSLATQVAGVWLNTTKKPAAPGTGGYGFQTNAVTAAQYIVGALGGSPSVIP